MTSTTTSPPPRVLFIYPPITRFERYSSAIGSVGGQQIPLGIFYCAAYLLKNGIEANVLDAEAGNKTVEQIHSFFQQGGYNLLGISTTTVAFHRALEVAEYFKSRDHAVTIVVGGPHVSSQPEEVLQSVCFDFAVPFEGEVTFFELVKALSERTDVSRVKGIVYRDNGKVVRTEKRPLIEDISTLPFPAYELLPDIRRYTPPPCNYKKSPVVNVITGRGCPNTCTFCENTTFGRTLRLRSAVNVVEEIEHLFRTFNAREIAFVDDTFTMKPERIYEIFNLLDSRGLHFPFTCMARINTVNYELLKFMKEHGCWHISFGIESGDENILKVIRKNIRLEQVEEAIAACRRLGILTKGFFMVGHPLETVDSIETTIAFALKLPLDDAVVTINTPMPGTFQFEHAAEYGTLVIADRAAFNYWNPVFVPHGLTREILLSKHKEFYRRFYLRPRIVWRYFKDLFGTNGPKKLLQLLKALKFLLPDKREQ